MPRTCTFLVTDSKSYLRIGLSFTEDPYGLCTGLQYEVEEETQLSARTYSSEWLFSYRKVIYCPVLVYDPYMRLFAFVWGFVITFRNQNVQETVRQKSVSYAQCWAKFSFVPVLIVPATEFLLRGWMTWHCEQGITNNLSVGYLTKLYLLTGDVTANKFGVWVK